MAFLKKFCEKLVPYWDLMCRLYMAHIFFQSGMSKLDDWEATLCLFHQEYCVPCMPVAAYVATAAEILAPIMLVFGLGTRLAAFVLFILSIVVHITYPDFCEHYLWMLLCSGIALNGSGKITLDHYFWKEPKR